MNSINSIPALLRFLRLPAVFALLVLAGCTPADEVSTPRTFDFEPVALQQVDVVEATIIVSIDEYPPHLMEPLTEIPIDLRLDDLVNPSFISLNLEAKLVDNQQLIEQQVVVAALGLVLPTTSLAKDPLKLGDESYVELGVFPGFGDIATRHLLPNGGSAEPVTQVVTTLDNIGGQEGAIQLQYIIAIEEELLVEDKFLVEPQNINIQITLKY